MPRLPGGHRATHLREAHSLWARIRCPTLLIRGTEGMSGDYEKDGRADVFQNARVESVEEAGHWVHHDQLEVVIELLDQFLGEPE